MFLVGVIFWITFMLANLLRFDFRGDLDQIDTLKALPVPAAAIASAQLVAPVAVLSIYQMVLLTSIGVMLHTAFYKLALVMLFALPLNAMLIAVENLIFLIFPVAQSRSALAIFRALVGKCWSFCSKALCCSWRRLLPAESAPPPGGSAEKRPALCLHDVVALLGEVIGMIPLLVLAFREFDPSIDTPA